MLFGDKTIIFRENSYKWKWLTCSDKDLTYRKTKYLQIESKFGQL